MSKEKRFEVFYNDESGKWVIKDNEQLPNLLDNYKTCIRLNEFNDKVTDLEAKLDEKKKEITNVYPFLKEYDNGVFTEYNVVYERDGIVATTCFGKNKEMAYEYLKTLRNDIKVVSQNQKAIEQLEKVKDIILNERKITSFNFDIFNKGKDTALFWLNEQIDQQIEELKGKVEE